MQPGSEEVKEEMQNEKEGGAASPPANLPAGARRQRSLLNYAGLTARGFCMGAADVVPGVSGGTMAFILGIYEELIQSIRMVGQPQFLRLLFSFRLREAFQLLNWPFLAAVAAGIFLAVLTLAPGLEWLLIHQPIIIWSFFFGLIVASVWVVSKRVTQWGPSLVLALAGGALGAYIIVGLVPVQTPEDWWFLFLSGALAITAMILPGISGAFILVLLGKYQFVLSAVNQRDIFTIAIVGLGAVVGLVTFAQILGWFFKRHHDLTVAILIGLMIGSLRKVWPWKIDVSFIVDRHGQQIPVEQHNFLPPLFINGGLNQEVFIALLLALAAFGVVLLLDRLANAGK